MLRAVAHLLDEHAAAQRVMGLAKKALDPFDAARLGRALHFLEYVMDRVHHAKEEDALFVALRQEADAAGQETIARFQAQHTKGHAYLKAAKGLLLQAQSDPLAASALASTFESYLRHYTMHMKQEERVLFPLAEEILPRSIDSELLAHFHRLEALLIKPGDYQMYLEFSKQPARVETLVVTPQVDHLETIVMSDRIVLFDDGSHRNVLFGDSYVISDGHDALLLDPSEAQPHVDDLQLEYVLFSHPYGGASPNRWLSDASTVLVPAIFPSHGRGTWSLRHDPAIKTLPDEGGLITLGDNDLALLPAHFLNAPAALHIFDPISKTLFSGELGASPNGGGTGVRVVDFDDYVGRMGAFFSRIMGSRAVVRAWAEMVRQLDVRRIAPRGGPILEGEEMVGRFLDWCSTLECGTDLLIDRFLVPTRRCLP